MSKDQAQLLGCKLTIAEKKSLESKLFEDLKYLMKIDNISIVEEILMAFLEKWKHLVTFIIYFKWQWLNKPNEYSNNHGINKVMLINAYCTRILRIMSMTNMLESWHKHLKYNNFEGKINRHIDILIYELYVVMEGDA
ncbi:4251_t:CDS:1 [Cetraspora pellucida]|uniref:4251_t:CDS:1 n=1 Tax=Cetraspora pellucida TaxID=1433469 RepID=A0A9N9INN9_9GLOM|nr:4251_t:CDS:1 [Cetraspora pellucida]